MRLILVLAALVLVAGCAQPAKVANMTAHNIAGATVAANPDMIGALSVGAVTGGEETDPLWTSEVDGPSFKAALEQSLQTNALLSVDAPKAPYRVEAHLGELQQPLIAATAEVTSTVQYKVFDQASGALWFERTVSSVGTASIGDAFYGVERLRIANERSILGNIQQFISAFTEEWKKRPAATS